MEVVKEAQNHVKSWIKTTLGTIAGLISGAVVMWFSPLLDKVIKPAKPVANFSYQVNGLEVTFANLSSGCDEVRWDFGDGSPLEFTPKDTTQIVHVYKKPGKYNVKLTVQNILDQVNERSILVDIDKADQAIAQAQPAPEIIDFLVRPPIKDGPVFAPATYQFEATADNSQLLIWDFGDGKGLTIGEPRELRIFDKPGTYKVKLTAFNGKNRSERTTTVNVQEAPANTVQLALQVTGTGQKRTQESRIENYSRQLQIMPNMVRSIDYTIRATPGTKIVRCEFQNTNLQNVIHPVSSILKNGQEAKISATIDPKETKGMAILNTKILLVEEKVQSLPLPTENFTYTVTIPGRQMIKLADPQDLIWSNINRQYQMKLTLNNQTVWEGNTLPNGVTFYVNGKAYSIVAQQRDNEIEILISQGQITLNQK